MILKKVVYLVGRVSKCLCAKVREPGVECIFLGGLKEAREDQGTILHCEPERSNQETSSLHLSRNVDDVS
jgi:hypothetical protein